MELSKEQIQWMVKAEKGNITLGNDYYNSHSALKDLVASKKLIDIDTRYIGEGQLDISGYHLTPDGKAQLDIYEQRIKRDTKLHLVFPLWVTMLSALLAFISGFLLGKLS
ncbi:hypothetical protein QYI97_13425 [Lacticaseibacillus paracasei]|uniref:hypothetical protein n=1 Tax=Lacticaseibacillus paracasei TaxID=1597 RepID=UPI0023494070|nr:hypothetical protein [Lacticaseibacillus paracasei]MDC6274343.1 hypothetical protein [Lacticaseibacillus paracasei]MDN4555221.1 hypothetical protein [Lacticaseibacillus paracasei]